MALEQFAAREAEGAALLKTLPFVPRRTKYSDMFEESVAMNKVRIALVLFADKYHNTHPNFKGYFDEWVLARVVKRCDVKHGRVAAEVDDYVLCSGKASVYQLEGGSEFCTSIFSTRLVCLCCTQIDHIEIL